MKFSRILLPLLGLVLIYSGCRKSETASLTDSQNTASNKVTTMKFYSPANVVVNSIESDTLITDFRQLAYLISQQGTQTIAPAAVPALGGLANPSTYKGNIRTYDCGSNTWSYTFNWEIALGTSDILNSGTGSLIIGSFSQTAAFQVTSTYIRYFNGLPFKKVWVVQFVISGVPDDDNYCNTDSMQNAISFSYQAYSLLTHQLTTLNSAASFTESISPNSYIIYPYLVASVTALGNNTFNIYVVPGVLACGPCHESALGFSPTMYFYYHLVGSASAWSSVASDGNNLNGFNVNVTQAGTYEYYTQGYITPGVLSDALYSGTITVQ